MNVSIRAFSTGSGTASGSGASGGTIVIGHFASMSGAQATFGISTDNAIIMARMRLKKAARALEKGTAPPGLDPQAHKVRSASFILPEDGAFKETALEATEMKIGEPFVAV